MLVTFNTIQQTLSLQAKQIAKPKLTIKIVLQNNIFRRRLHKPRGESNSQIPNSGERNTLRLSAYVPNSEPKLRPYRYVPG